MISTQHRVRIPIACPHKSAMNENSSLNASDYTEESWKVFADALQKAQAVLQDESATEQQVQDALAALNSARAGLKLADDSTDGVEDGVESSAKTGIGAKINPQVDNTAIALAEIFCRK